MSMRQPIPKLKTHNFLERIAGALEEMVSKSEIILEEQPKVQELAYIKYSSQVFSSLKLPPICILDYLQRVVTGGEITHTAVILALIYIDRAISMMRVFPTSYSIHRLLLGSLVLGTKMQEDRYLTNSLYAKVGGVHPEELCRLEWALFRILDYKLIIPGPLFLQYSLALSPPALPIQIVEIEELSVQNLRVERGTISVKWKLLRICKRIWGVIKQAKYSSLVKMRIQNGIDPREREKQVKNRVTGTMNSQSQHNL